MSLLTVAPVPRCSCRKRDEDESIRIPLSRSSASCISLPSLSTLTTVFDEQGRPPRNIVAPASPTVRTYPSPPFDPLERDSPPPSDKAVLSSSVAASPPRHLSARPLPPRQNPSTFSGSPRSIDLVNPFASQYGASFAAAAAPFSMPASLDDAVRWGNPGALEPLRLVNGRGGVTGMPMLQEAHCSPPNTERPKSHTATASDMLDGLFPHSSFDTSCLT